MSHTQQATAALEDADRMQALARYQQLRPALEDGVPLAQVRRPTTSRSAPRSAGSRSIAPTDSLGSCARRALIGASIGGSFRSCSA